MTGIVFILISALVFPGLINRIRGVASGRKGPGILQPLKDVNVLLKKGSVFSTTSGVIFQIAPVISVTSLICAMLLIPFGNLRSIISFGGDFILFSYLLALGKFFSIIAALDTGSSFEGMGANREAFFSMIAEPVFFILMATFAMLTGYTSFTDIFNGFYPEGNHYVYIFSIIGLYLLIQIAIVENCRVPVDDPKTHLELTMIHEVMILDNSGFDKALIHIGSWLRFTVFGALIFDMVVPAGWNILFQIILFFLVQISFAVTIGLIESFRARNKMNKNPKFILSLSAIAIVAFLVVLMLTD